jgi:putative DNA primase/helicase
MSSEAGIVFGGHGMSRDAVMRNLSLLNAFWDGIRVSVDRRQSESFTVEGARLTMGLAVQPDTVRAFMEATKGLARGNGFAARFLIAWPESTQGTRLFKEAGAWCYVPAFHQRLRELLARTPKPDPDGVLSLPVIDLDVDAARLWIRFHDDVEREMRHSGEMSEIRDVASKAADNAARLAGLFHLFEQGPEGCIGRANMESAAKIVGWHLFEARRFLSDVAAPRERSNASRLDAWLIDYCRRSGQTEVDRRFIQNSGPNPIRSKAALNDALAELVDVGRILQVEDGRRRLIRVNPALLGDSDGAS